MFFGFFGFFFWGGGECTRIFFSEQPLEFEVGTAVCTAELPVIAGDCMAGVSPLDM